MDQDPVPPRLLLHCLVCAAFTLVLDYLRNGYLAEVEHLSMRELHRLIDEARHYQLNGLEAAAKQAVANIEKARAKAVRDERKRQFALQRALLRDEDRLTRERQKQSERKAKRRRCSKRWEYAEVAVQEDRRRMRGALSDLEQYANDGWEAVFPYRRAVDGEDEQFVLMRKEDDPSDDESDAGDGGGDAQDPFA